MRIALTLLALLGVPVLLALPAPARAAESKGGFGIGVIVGEPTGISLKFRSRGGPHGVDAGLAWSFTNGTDFHFHADYLWHDPGLIKVKKGLASVYWGIGGRILVENAGDDHVGIRIPVGVSYEFASAPFDVFGEIAPIVDLTPETELAFNAGVGVRIWLR